MARKPKNKNQKQYGNKFNKDLKKKNLWKKDLRYTQNIILHIKDLCVSLYVIFTKFSKREKQSIHYFYSHGAYILTNVILFV